LNQEIDVARLLKYYFKNDLEQFNDKIEFFSEKDRNMIEFIINQVESIELEGL